MFRVHGLRNPLTAAGLIALMGVSTSRAAAQTTASASIDATALVLGIAPLTAVGVNDLDFGSVAAGSVGTPASAAANAGRWDVTGEPLAPVSVSFALPTVLTGPALATIPISFNATDGLLWDPYPGTFTTFNPNALSATALTLGGTLTVGISGSVAPPTGTVTGTYTGTITLTVSYL